MQFVENSGLSKREFYAKTSISRGTLENPSGITEDIISRFIATYPNISPSWLITGEGSMLKSHKDPRSNHVTTSDLPPGPCRECALRDKLIARQEQTIELLSDKINDLQLQLSNNDTNNDNGHGYKQTG